MHSVLKFIRVNPNTSCCGIKLKLLVIWNELATYEYRLPAEG
jgi:hypothetical protein